MAKLKDKLAIVEDLTNSFIDENASNYAKQYQIEINALQDRAIVQVTDGGKLSPKILVQPKKIVGVQKNIRNAYILGAASVLTMQDRNLVLQRTLKPIADFMKLYQVKEPLKFARQVDRIVQHSLGNKVRLTDRERAGLGLLNKYMSDNKVEIQKLVDTSRKELAKINKQISTNQSRAIIKRRKQLIKERVEVNGVKRPLTNKEIATRLKSEFKNDEARLNRILQTEVHRQDELVKEVQAQGLGFKFKTWNTQRDRRVRTTHAVLDRKKVKVTAKFNVGGHRASFPSDPVLPPEESINCRCFLTFS